MQDRGLVNAVFKVSPGRDRKPAAQSTHHNFVKDRGGGDVTWRTASQSGRSRLQDWSFLTNTMILLLWLFWTELTSLVQSTSQHQRPVFRHEDRLPVSLDDQTHVTVVVWQCDVSLYCLCWWQDSDRVIDLFIYDDDSQLSGGVCSCVTFICWDLDSFSQYQTAFPWWLVRVCQGNEHHLF